VRPSAEPELRLSHSPRVRVATRPQYDYVIVGAGAAGCVVASRLAEDPSLRVCLLEAGPTDQGDARVHDIRRWPELTQSDLDYDWKAAPLRLGNDNIRLAAGRVLGGCTSHNNCIAFRAPAVDMEAWKRAGLESWGASQVAPYFAKVMRQFDIRPARSDNEVAQAFVAAAQHRGFPLVDMSDSNLSDGVGWLRLTADGTRRQSAASAYLSRCVRNLSVVTDTSVRRVQIGSRRALGVETEHGFVAARREVIICCGAVGTPMLLLRSGIGPARHLCEIGLTVVLDLPGVGEHLLDHPEGIVLWEALSGVPSTGSNMEAALFARTRQGIDHPDVMFHLLTMRFDLHTVAQGYPTATNVFSLQPYVTRARSTGTVRLTSADDYSPPAIDLNYFADDARYDEQTMVAALRLARVLGKTPPLSGWIARELAPGPGVGSYPALAQYARLTASTGYHLAGTCKMGREDDPLAVVDDNLRVRGIDGLRVADASVFPSMVGVNIALTCMMIGERAAAFIRSEAAGG
jgi:choline oxidase